jgi:hypothetical protein
MDKKIFTFNDQFKIIQDLNITDSYKEDLEKDDQSVKPLYVKAIATHSAKVINNRIYPPHKMRVGANSFLYPYSKPVLTHHLEDDRDPIGRVVSTKYVDISDGFKSKLIAKSIDVDNFNYGKLNNNEYVKFLYTY